MNKTVLICLLLTSIKVNNADNNKSRLSLKQLHIIFRHGERAPTETYINDPYVNMTWSGGWGQLTNRGKLEMYNLGIKLKQLYANFIPDYYFHNDVQVLSSYADRCLMSAQVLLAAVFSPRDEQIWNDNLLWQPIPVHYVPRGQDKLIAMKAPCKKYDEEFEKVLKSQTIQLLNKENSALFHYLSEHTGQLIDNIGSVEMLYNTLEIELLHNLTLPDWTRNVSLNHMKYLAARYLEVFTTNEYMKKMKGGYFLQKVTSFMHHGASGPFLYIYAVHDVTIVNILKTLGYKKLLKPDFGASFIMELYHNCELKMIYRNGIQSTPEEITFPNGPARYFLDNFENNMKDLFPSDWEKECNS